MSFLGAAAQGVHGQVTDINGKPLPHAEVVLNGRRRVSLSSSARFSLILPSDHRHELVLSLRGYETKTVGFEVTEGTRRRKNVVMDRSFGEGVEFHSPERMAKYMGQLATRYEHFSHSSVCLYYVQYTEMLPC